MANAYQDAGFVVVALLIIVAFGFIARWSRAFPAEAIPLLNKYVFYFGIPSAVFTGLASQNLYKLDWNYALSFLILRAVAGFLCAIYTLLRRQDLGAFLTHYLGSTWMNTIIFGVPILTVLYGPQVGLLYPVLASLSSFVFQLPLLLTCFEVREFKKDHPTYTFSNEDPHSGEVEEVSVENPGAEKDIEAQTKSKTVENEEEQSAEEHTRCGGWAFQARARLLLLYARAHGVYERRVRAWYLREQKKHSLAFIGVSVAQRVVVNPPLLGIVIGIIWSLSGSPVHPIVSKFTGFLSDSVTPVSCFTIGMFMYQAPWKTSPLRTAWLESIIYLILKHLVLPLLLIPFLLALGISGTAAKMGVIIASLPAAITAFTLAKQYDNRPDIQSTVVVVGTIIMLPTVLLWIAVVDNLITF